MGLMGGIVWNESTGNLVSGHQKVSIMDEVNRYNTETLTNDYRLRVSVVHLSDKEEREQNLFMNNKAVQGEFDDDMLIQMLGNIDYRNAGFDDFDMDMLGIGISDIPDEVSKNDISDIVGEVEDISWCKENIVRDNEVLAKVDSETHEAEENTKIDRSTDFYHDSEENQIARHNEIQKIKDRISKHASTDNDRIALSYVVLQFDSISETEIFLQQYGYPVDTKVISGTEFQERLEFGES